MPKLVITEEEEEEVPTKVEEMEEPSELPIKVEEMEESSELPTKVEEMEESSEHDFVVVSPPKSKPVPETTTFDDGKVAEVTAKVKDMLKAAKGPGPVVKPVEVTKHMRELDEIEERDRTLALERAKRSDRDQKIYVEANKPNSDTNLAADVWKELVKEEQTNVSVFKRRSDDNKAKTDKALAKKKKQPVPKIQHAIQYLPPAPSSLIVPVKSNADAEWAELQALESQAVASFRAVTTSSKQQKKKRHPK